jgi:hypothetical protein
MDRPLWALAPWTNRQVAHFQVADITCTELHMQVETLHWKNVLKLGSMVETFHEIFLNTHVYAKFDNYFYAILNMNKL